MGFFPAAQDIQSRVRSVSMEEETGARADGEDKGWKAKEDGYDDGDSSGNFVSVCTLSVTFSLDDQDRRPRQ